MSPIPFLNRHPRAGLSAYLDGEMTPGSARRLEAHLADCAACAAELEALRETRSAVRSLPEAAAPRSFALTPEMARDARRSPPAPAPRPLQPVINGLRLTSAGLAAALAVVVVIAVAGGGSNGNSGGDNSLARIESTSTSNIMADRDQSQATGSPGYQSLDHPEATAAATGSGGTSGGVGGAGSGGTAGGGNAAPPSAAADTGTLHASPSPSLSDEYFYNVPKSTTNATTAPEVNATSSASNSGGGIGTLTVVATVLGVLLAAALIASFAASRFTRRTPR